VTPARRIAFEILGAVDRGGFASDLLAAQTRPLDGRDAGLVHEIVFGVLRHRAQLDYLIAHAASRPLHKLDPGVLRALRMGAYQMRFLTRIPPHAAVGESVDLVKRTGKSSAAGFVNAVLRKLGELPADWGADEIRYSLPAWLWQRWVKQYGAETAAKIGAASLVAPEPTLREGRQMDLGAQSIVPLLGLEPGHRFLDLCACPGNKTLQALETPIRAVACDSSAARLQNFLAPCPRVRLDATRALPFQPVFDRILVDAPCTGSGTLARNPEIRWRLNPEDIQRQALRQAEILRFALRVLKPGGRLVYSTCSLEKEENQDVVFRIAASRVVRFVERLPGVEPGDGFFAAILQ